MRAPMFDSIALPDPAAQECAATAADALKESHDSPTALEILVPGISCPYATPGNGSVSAQEGEAPISGTMSATIAATAQFCNFIWLPPPQHLCFSTYSLAPKCATNRYPLSMSADSDSLQIGHVLGTKANLDVKEACHYSASGVYAY
mgnify:CR=1 FL=1